MAMEVLATQLIKIFLMVLVGYIVKRSKLMTNAMQSGLSNLLLLCVLPLDIVAAGNRPYDPAFSRGIFLMLAIGFGYYAVSLLLVWGVYRFLPVPNGRKNLSVFMAIFMNAAFIGFPIAKGLFGAEGYMYAVVFNFMFQLFVATAGVKLMDKSERFNFRKFFFSPIILAPIIALVIYFTPIRLPGVVHEVCETIGSMTVPLSMLIIGGSLADIKLSSLWKEKWSYVVSLFRLLVLPLLMLLAMWLLGIDGVVGSTGVLITALASGSLCVVYAERYRQDVAFAASTVIQTMVLMVPTLPFVMWCTAKVLG